MRTDELQVSIGGRPVGRLMATRRGARFAYADEIVRESMGQPLLSLSLPVKARPYAEGLTGFWFRGLLPEGKRLEAIARYLGCGEGDYFSILRHIGWECAGAVSIGEEGFETKDNGSAHPLSDAGLTKLLNELPQYGGMDPTARVSLGGFQEKLLVKATDVQVEDGHVEHARWFVPDAQTISSHIIKPQPKGRFAGIVEAEAWAMSVASYAARCAKVALLCLDGAPDSLVIERYDRVREGDCCKRMHQEDCCQALGIDPMDKYARYDRVSGGDPTYAKIASLLNAYAADPQEECSELLRQVVVNFVLGNVDAHAKNYSLLCRRLGIPEVSPLYDVVPVVDIEPRARHLSLRLDGKIMYEDVGRTQILNEAALWGMENDVAAEILDSTLERIEEGLLVASRLYPRAAIRHEPGARGRIRSLRP